MNQFQLLGHAGLAVCLYRPYVAQADKPLLLLIQVRQKQIITNVGTDGRIPIKSTSAGTFATLGVNMIRPDQLLRSRFVPPSTIALDFADASFPLEIGLLEMPTDRIQWETATACPTGDAMIVQAVKGGSIPIDSSALRYLVDPTYAAKIDKSISDLHMTPAQANEAADLSRRTRDPRWNEVGDEDDLFE